jgi:ABC-2 type transport system permease protein
MVSTNRKWEAILSLMVGLAFIALLNILSSRYFFRIDLTEEKRYTISDATKQMLRELDDVVYIEVYLEGDFPAGFKRLQKSIRETLDEFRIYGGSNIQFVFTDPEQGQSEKARNEFFVSLAEKGIQPTNLFANEKGKKTEKLIFPGAVVSYGGEEKGVMLLKGNKAASPDEILNQSVEGVEYELASAIHQLTRSERKRIALLQGHGQLDSLDIASVNNALLEHYDVFKVRLSEKKSLAGYDAIVMAKPQMSFSEQDKYKIDQFVMNGGKALFFIDALRVNMDSIGEKGTYAFPYELNIEDMLFKYGVRLNNDFVLDLNSGAYPVMVGNMGTQPQIKMMPWPFFPVINQYGDHPIVKNLDAVYARFVGSIDTVKAVGVKKTPLMFTSSYTRKATSPVKVSFNDLRKEINPDMFNQGAMAVAYLLEGRFTSLYKNRILPEGVRKDDFKEEGSASKILVCADGDLLRNEVNKKTRQPLALGFEPFSRRNFANQEFLINALAYLLEEDGIITAKAKEIKIRPLDKIKVEKSRVQWQAFNLILPVVLVIWYGVFRYFWRKRKFARF